MYAIVDDAIYIENTITETNEIFSYQNILNVVLPNKDITSPSNDSFTTSHPTVEDEEILVFNSEFPAGKEDVVGVVVDNGDGTYTCPVGGTYTVDLEAVYKHPRTDLTMYPAVTNQGADIPNHIDLLDLSLTYVSSTASEIVLDSEDQTGFGIMVNDVISVTVVGVEEDVTVTAVAVTGVIGDYTYTCAIAPTDIPEDAPSVRQARGTPNTLLTATRDGNDANVTLTYQEEISDLSIPWNVMARKIVSQYNWNVVEPFTMLYTEAI